MMHHFNGWEFALRKGRMINSSSVTRATSEFRRKISKENAREEAGRVPRQGVLALKSEWNANCGHVFEDGRERLGRLV